MKQVNFDRAFDQTPDDVRSSIELGFRKGKHAMKMRHKIQSALSVAACLAIVCAVAAIATTRWTAPKPDVYAQPKAQATPGPLFSDTAVYVYATEGGWYFHMIDDCSGLQGARAKLIDEAIAAGKQPCPDCAADFPVYILSDGCFYHAKPHCYGMQNATSWTLLTVMDDPKYSPCEACWNGCGYPPVYATEGGVYVHAIPDCSGMQGAQEYALAQALNQGKQPCPVCGGEIRSLMEAGNTSVTANPTLVPEERNVEPYLTSTPMASANPTLVPEERDVENTPTPMPQATLQLWEIAPLVTAMADDEASEPLFYAMERGIYVHSIPDCHSMQGVQRYSWAAIEAMGKEICPRCGDAILEWLAEGGVSQSEVIIDSIAMPVPEDLQADGGRFVYYTPGGVYYHIESGCSGMQGAGLHSLLSAIQLGKFHCPACIGEDHSAYWLPVSGAADDLFYTMDGDDCFHCNPECTITDDPSTIYIASYAALFGAKQPCPACMPESETQIASSSAFTSYPIAIH